MGNTITDADIESGKPLSGPSGLLQKVKDQFSDIYGTLNTIRTDQVKNGSFETCTLADGKTPDNWTVTDYPGGSHSLDNANARIGGYALAFVHPGGINNGGGYAETDYYECYPANFTPNNLFLTFSWWHKASNTAMKNLFYVRFFDATHVWISDEVLWCNLDTNALGSISTYRWYCGSVLPPSNAVYYKIRVVGGESTVNQAGTAWFDGILKLDERPNVLDMELTAGAGSSSTYEWVDVYTIPLPLMFSTNEKISFTVAGIFDGSISSTGGIRFRIGTNYSTEYNGSGDWTSVTLQLTSLGSSPTSKYQPIVMQARNDSYQTTSIRKSVPGTSFVIASNLGLPAISV